MVVVNIVGFPYKVKLKSGVLVIPNDNRPHVVPDELADLFSGKNNDNVFRVLVPPKPKGIIKQTTSEILESTVKVDIIEINLDDEVKKPPLKGKKIKAKKRKALTKKRVKKEE